MDLPEEQLSVDALEVVSTSPESPLSITSGSPTPNEKKQELGTLE